MNSVNTFNELIRQKRQYSFFLFRYWSYESYKENIDKDRANSGRNRIKILKSFSKC